MDFTMNDMALKNLKPEAKEFTRREKGGFGVRVLPSGTKTLFYMYRVAGQRKFLNLGEYYEPKYKGEPKGNRVTLSEARSTYETEKKKVALYVKGQGGADPVKLKRETRQKHVDIHKAHSVKDLVKDYIERHAQRFKKSWEKDQQILNRDVVPVWGQFKAADIKKRDVLQLLEGIVDRGAPAMANNCFQIIRKMFNWAVEQDILPHSPCTGIKLPSPKLSRDRTLSEAEIKTFWNNLDNCAMSDEIKRTLKLILVTAQRPGEVIGMHTSELDGNWWTIPAERAKNGKAHRVYLTKTALDLIGPLEVMDKKTGEVKDKGFIFRTPLTKKEQAIAPQALIVAVARGLAFPLFDAKGNQLFTKEGKPATENRLGIDHFTPHDLRRTAATFMAKSGEMDEVIDAILNHAKQGVIKVYNQYRYDREKQLALETWERKLKSIIAGTKGNVIPMQRTAS